MSRGEQPVWDSIEGRWVPLDEQLSEQVEEEENFDEPIFDDDGEDMNTDGYFEAHRRSDGFIERKE